MESYTVPDGNGRELRFDGECIGTASSARPGKDRWSEVTVYRTRGGQYVVALVGRSTRPGEVDFHHAQLSERPEGAIEYLYKYDSDGARYLPWVHREALAQACDADEALRAAYAVEHVA